MSGSLVHFEIRAGDAERAQAFWGSLLGWSFNAQPGEFPYAMSEAGGGPTAGLYRSDSDARGILPYFAVHDLDTALDKVRELSGTVESSGPVGGVGWYGRCVDTEGNAFGLFESDPSAPAE
jgi:uncharacterized protein